jgi:hypothetical protein
MKKKLALALIAGGAIAAGTGAGVTSAGATVTPNLPIVHPTNAVCTVQNAANILHPPSTGVLSEVAGGGCHICIYKINL